MSALAATIVEEASAHFTLVEKPLRSAADSTLSMHFPEIVNAEARATRGPLRHSTALASTTLSDLKFLGSLAREMDLWSLEIASSSIADLDFLDLIGRHLARFANAYAEIGVFMHDRLMAAQMAKVAGRARLRLARSLRVTSSPSSRPPSAEELTFEGHDLLLRGTEIYQSYLIAPPATLLDIALGELFLPPAGFAHRWEELCKRGFERLHHLRTAPMVEAHLAESYAKARAESLPELRQLSALFDENRCEEAWDVIGEMGLDAWLVEFLRETREVLRARTPATCPGAESTPK